MEFEKLQPFVIMIVLVGMILGIGVLTFDKFGIAAKDSTNIVNETGVTFTVGAGQTTNDDVTAMTYVGNSTVSCTVFNSASWCANWTTAGVITLNSSTFAGVDINGSYNVSYVYDADTTTTTTMSSMTTAVSPIASTWLPLIITVVALSIILVLVIRSFSRR